MSASDDNAGILQDMGIQVVQEFARLNGEIEELRNENRRLNNRIKQWQSSVEYWKSRAQVPEGFQDAIREALDKFYPSTD